MDTREIANDANDNASGGNTTRSPLGSLRDRIDQLTGSGRYINHASKSKANIKGHETRDDTRATPSSTTGFPPSTGTTNRATVSAADKVALEDSPRTSSNTTGMNSSAMHHTTRDQVKPTSTSSDRNVDKSRSTATGTGVGTSVGLMGSYDFLRTGKSEANNTSLVDTDGPEHIAPPPGSREPPVTKDTSSYRNANT